MSFDGGVDAPHVTVERVLLRLVARLLQIRQLQEVAHLLGLAVLVAAAQAARRLRARHISGVLRGDLYAASVMRIDPQIFRAMFLKNEVRLSKFVRFYNKLPTF